MFYKITENGSEKGVSEKVSADKLKYTNESLPTYYTHIKGEALRLISQATNNVDNAIKYPLQTCYM